MSTVFFIHLQKTAGTSINRAAVEQLLDDLQKAGEFLDSNEGVQEEFASELGRLKAEKAGDRIGPYILLEQVGAGSFG